MRKALLVLLTVAFLLVGCGGSNEEIEEYAENEMSGETNLDHSSYANELSESEQTVSEEFAPSEQSEYEPLQEQTLPTLTPFPDAIPQNVIAISAAHEHNLAITLDGALWAWGAPTLFNIYPKWFSPLGDGTIEPRNTPVKIMENVIYAVAGPHHSFAITADGGLYTWGANAWGNIGDGTTEPRFSPVRVLDDVIYATMPLGVPCSHVGYIGARTYAIRADNSLWAWGNAEGGEWGVTLGDGSGESQLLPVKIMENVRAVVPTQIGGHAVTNDGVLWEWRGYGGWFLDFDGQAVVICNLYPSSRMPNVASLTACGGFAITNDGELFLRGDYWRPVMDDVIYATRLGGAKFAITADNTLWAWGLNSIPGQWRLGPVLGDGTTTYRETPVRIMENVATVTAVGHTVYAIQIDGTLWSWGSADTDIRLSPVKIMENVVQVTATYVAFDHGWVRSFRSFAVTENGELWAWGENDDFDRGFSLLGDGTSESRPYPVRIIGGIVCEKCGENCDGFHGTEEPINNFSSQEITNARLAQMVNSGEIPADANVLHLDGNYISDISPLSSLTELGFLSLRNNQISDITPLADLTRLWLLDLNNNQISDITPLANLTNLSYLYLNENQIYDITPLAPLRHLRILGLNYNQIINITPLVGLTWLRGLGLSGNQISDISEIANLTDLAKHRNWRQPHQRHNAC